jgi:Stage II sporulation protein E (SpoIIE)
LNALLILLPLLVLVPPIYGSSDSFRAAAPGPAGVNIDGQWQFHLGDDPSWSNPTVDDANWEQLTADSTWGEQTHPGYTGFAWYRKHIQVTGRAPRISILIPSVDDAYEVFWNGRKIGEYGKLPPHAWWWQYPREVVYSLGSAPLDGVLALRVWKAPIRAQEAEWWGGPESTPVLGSPIALTRWSNLVHMQQEDVMIPRFMFSGALLITGLITLLLFLRDRRSFFYLWLTLFLLADVLVCWQGLNSEHYGWKAFPGACQFELVNALQSISLWLLLLTLFGLHTHKIWQRWTGAMITLYLASMATDLGVLAFWERAGKGMQAADLICIAVITFMPVYTLVIVVSALLRRPSWALVPLALAATLYNCYTLASEASWLGVRYTHIGPPWHLNPGIPLGPYTIGIPAILNTVLFLVLLFTVARYYSRERQRQAHIEREIDSAREVQHVLIPSDAPAIPGFVISTVYKPATEVGGDFYQVIPLPSIGEVSRAMILLGDVSGKGLKAAMTVSLIVGTMRALAEYTCDPAEMLTQLNQRMLGRTRGGFTTCVAMRVETTGTVVIANAGHISPYCADREIELPGSLPLGLTADATYESQTFNLLADESLTLFTDGIVEARNIHGELYGFERVSALMRDNPTAQQIVDAASNFGQDDDITVLSVKRVVEFEPIDASINLVAQIAV